MFHICHFSNEITMDERKQNYLCHKMEIMEVTDSRKTAVICLFIFRKNDSDNNYETKHAIIVYFCYFVMKSERFVLTIVKQ